MTWALIHMDGTRLMGRWSDLTGQPHPLSTGDYILQYAEEFRGSLGHIALLGIHEYVLPFRGGAGNTAYDAVAPDWTYVDAARAQGVRLRVFTGVDNPPVVKSVVDIWNSANWFEREAFDLFGILFDGHPDLRRILTDYGFIGHPFRKDFPLIGNVEVIYDADKGRVAYQPVSIEERTLVPRVIRDDNRYSDDLKDGADG